jgi:hypothetical protein
MVLLLGVPERTGSQLAPAGSDASNSGDGNIGDGA